MHLLWISHLLPYPPKGGVLIRSYNNIKQISKYHDICFIGLYQTAHQLDLKSVEHGKIHLAQFCKRIAVFSFESFKTKFQWYLLAISSFFTFASYKEAWCRSKSMASSIKNMLREEHFDLVHFDTISLLQYYSLLPVGTPICINHHNIESHMMLRRFYTERNWFVKMYCYLEATKLKRLEKTYCKKGINLVVSELDRKRLKKIVPSSRTEVIPNGVDINYFRRIDVREITNSMIFVGGLTWYPNIDAMTFFCNQVWPLLITQVPDAKLFIVGKSPPASLRQLAVRDHRIQIKGFVDDIIPLMSAATCYVCPIRTGGGTRLKVLDALALGVPLVATRIACEGIRVKNMEHVLFADTAESFVEAITMLFSHRRLRHKLRRNSRMLVETYYDYDKIGLTLKRCYEQEANLAMGR